MTESVTKKRWYEKIPHTYVILFFMIILASILTWVLPAGEFVREEVEGLNKPVVVPGSYTSVEQQGVGPFDVFRSIPEGMIGASQIIYMILISTASFGIINSTGAIDSLVATFLNGIRKRKISNLTVIWIITFAFSILGIFVGPEIQIPFTLIGISIALGLGYDTIVGLGMIMGGGFAGFNYGPINASILGTSHSIVGLPIFSGGLYRLLIWFVGTALVALIVSLYAKRIEKDKTKSFVYGQDTTGLGFEKDLSEYKLESRHIIVLLVLLAEFIFIVIGTTKWGWYLTEMATVFLIGGLVAGYLAGYNTDKIIELFTKGVSSAAAIALILGIARGIQITLEQGMIMDTIINYLSKPLEGMSSSISAIFISILTGIVHFFIPSGSGLAVSLMPVISPLGTIAGLSQQTTVLAFQMGATIPNYIFQTVGAMMAMLGIAKVPINKWFKMGLLLTIASYIMAFVFIVIAVIIGY